MRILIGAFGTRGDVQPMAALARALHSRGHQVEMAVPPSSLALARRLGAEAFPVGLDYEKVSRRASNGSMRELLGTLPLVRGEVAAQLNALEAKSAAVNLIVGSSVFTVGALLAELRRVPYAFFAFCPQLFPSAEHPSPLIPFQRLPRWMNRASWRINEWAWARMLRETLDAARTARGLLPIGELWGNLIGSHPVLACDAALAPAPADFAHPVAQVGALFAEDPSALSRTTAAFLESGKAPVYIGFGSMSDPNPPATTARIVEAVRRAGARAIVARGWAGLGTLGADGDDVCFIGSEPHAALFPRCAAVVHHGGAGTTHAAARAGIPQVLMPQVLDQHYWAERAQRLGVTPGKVGRHDDDPEPLARALRACLEDAPLQERARALGRSIVENGKSRACELLEQLVSSGRASPTRCA